MYISECLKEKCACVCSEIKNSIKNQTLYERLCILKRLNIFTDYMVFT